MRKTLVRDMAFVGAFAAVLLLCCLCLVRGPSEETRPAETDSPGVACLMPVTGETEGRTGTDEGRQRREAPVALFGTETPPRLAGDRNGLPLQGLRWVRAAYAACPPEGVFG